MAKYQLTISGLKDALQNDANVQQAFAQNPSKGIDAFETVAQSQLPDTGVYRIVVWSLGSLIVIVALGAIILKLSNQDTPQILIAMGSAAIGALAGLLAPQPPNGH